MPTEPEPTISYDACEWRLLERTKDGNYLIQYFYITSEKLTDPLLIHDIRYFIDLYTYSFVEIRNYHGELKGWHKDGKPRFTLKISGNGKEYLRAEWHNNGQLKAKTDGTGMSEWYEDGQKKYESIQCEDEGKSSTCINWYEDGQLESEVRENKCSYISTAEWYPNSQKKKNGYLAFTNDWVDIEWDEKRQMRAERIQKTDDSWYSKGWNARGMLVYSYWVDKNKQTTYTPVFVRQLLKETPEGYLVQDFFEDGSKYTEPYLLLNKEDVTNHKTLSGGFNRDGLSINGLYVQFNDLSCKCEETYFEKGERVKGISWHDNGQVRAKWTESITQMWNESGQLSYESNHQIKTKTTWHENGLKQQQQYYDPETQLTVKLTWYKSGQQRMKSCHDKEGKLLSKYYWSEDGSPSSEMFYDGNIRWCKEWNSYPAHYQIIESSNLNTTVTFWKYDKKIIMIHSADAQENDEIIEWHDNGQIAATGQYVEDYKHGQWNYFYEDSKPQMQGEFLEGRQVGSWTYWDEQGNKTMEEKAQR